MNLSIENMRTILVVLLVTLFVFILIEVALLALNKFICWYFKINERVNQNNEIIKQLQQINLFNANSATSINAPGGQPGGKGGKGSIDFGKHGGIRKY